MKTSVKPDQLTAMTPREVYGHLDRHVVGQERAKRALSVAAYAHLKRCLSRRFRSASALRKSNVLLVGPTGSGKTHLARTLAAVLSVPFAACDATEYTEAGYYGKDVEGMVAELLQRAEQSLEEAQRGIIFIDEIDKIARRSQGARTGAGARDIGGEGVQQALLKLLEGREVSVPVGPAQSWSRPELVRVDTTDILFICAGTFSDLFASCAQRPVGFGRGGAPPERRRATVRQLVEFGMLEEFLGRLPVIAELSELGEEELLAVLTVPPDSVLREYRELLAEEDVELEVGEPALREMVRWSLERGLGARGLRSVVEEVLADELFRAPERRGTCLRLDPAMVRRRLAGLSVPLPG